jgi:hypothetical protein
MYKDLIQRFFVFLAILTSVGTLVHDTKLNKAYALSVPIASINFSSHLESLKDGTSHAHVESASAAQIFEGNPRIQARDDHRKYYWPKYMGRSTAFGSGSNILWPSV